MKSSFLAFSILLMLFVITCTKKQGVNPALAFSDKALLDSCRQTNLYYYKQDPNTLLSGSAGPHGTFKLRFNSKAFNALTDNGKLPENAVFPEGSLLVKDVIRGGQISLYAFMYKRGGSWLWGEIEPNGNILFSVNKNSSTCTGCHSQTGHRDLVVSFHVY